MDFNPKGLIRVYRQGTKNGKIIQWMQGNTVIFEWDQDLNNGSHYHALLSDWHGQHDGNHYWPGEPVPEPWNTMYFGG